MDLEEDDVFDATDDVNRDPEELAAITPLPPAIETTPETLANISSSPAYQTLDDLHKGGMIAATRVASLKDKYRQLFQMVKTKRERELSLIDEAKNLANHLDNLKSELSGQEQFPENVTTDTAKLRMTLLKYSNNYAELEDRLAHMEYKIQNLAEERDMLKRENDRLPNEEELNQREAEYTRNIAEMKKEIAHSATAIEHLNEEISMQNRAIDTAQKELQEVEKQLEEHKSELVGVANLPHERARDVERVTKQKINTEEQLHLEETKCHELLEQLKQLELQKRELENKKSQEILRTQQMQARIEDKQREVNLVNSELKHGRDHEEQLIADKATLDLNTKHLMDEKMLLNDQLNKKNREYDGTRRKQNRITIQKRQAEDNLQQLQNYSEKLSHQKLETPRDVQTQKAIVGARRDIVDLKRQVLDKSQISAEEKAKIDALIKAEERCLLTQSDLRIEVLELSRMAAIKQDEREQKSRKLRETVQRQTETREQDMSKRVALDDHQKKFEEVQSRLKDYSKLYNIIKSERNRLINMIQISTQKAAEMREKLKILQNETEILRTTVQQREKQLQMLRLKHISSMMIRDALRNELAKQKVLMSNLAVEVDQHRLNISKLNSLQDHAEQDMVNLRKSYEVAVQIRNDRGVQLIERNEEVCIFQEKINVQERLIKSGQVQIQEQEEEARFLQIELKEAQRQVDVIRKHLPQRRKLEQEVTTLQIQLAQCQQRLLQLERQVENPESERARMVGGMGGIMGPSRDAADIDNVSSEADQLQAVNIKQRVEQLENKIAAQEEKLLEKELHFEQVNRLVDRLRVKHDKGKEDTLTLAKQVNEQRSEIRRVGRKIKALVSELAMNTAKVFENRSIVAERTAQLEQHSMRMERGEPPSEEIERDWLKIVRDEERRKMDRKAAEEEAELEQRYQLAGGSTTTAEPRPNAYLPQGDQDLPIPRPYGAHPPFKPQEQGSSMRHIRKPNPKPIEI